MSRERKLMQPFASVIANYMNNIAKSNQVTIGVFQNGQLLSNEEKIGTELIQDISMDSSKSIMINLQNTQSQMLYHGQNPYELKKMGPQGAQTLYVDELYVMAQQKGKEKQQEKQAQAAPSTKKEKPLVLVGVSPNAVQFRRNKGGQQWVNIAIPWEQSQNNLGNIDIPRDLFDKANTAKDMQSRKTYHIPLMEQSYGLWYREKETGNPVKPVVSAKEIYQSYEANRAAYRMKQQQGQLKEMQSQVPQEPKQQEEQRAVQESLPGLETSEQMTSVQREIPDIPGVTDDSGSEFAVDDMDFNI